MASIAQYYAEVGVGLDRGSLRSVQAYLKNIERYFINFQRRVQRNQSLSLSLRVKVDTNSLQRNLQTSANRVAKSVIVPITRFSINQDGMSRAFNRAALNISQSLGSMSTKVDRAAMLQALQNGLNRVSKSLVLTISRFKINEAGLARTFNASFKKPAFSNRMQISVRLSQASLSGMRAQIRQALEGMTIRPTIRPRYQQGSGGGRIVGGGSDDWVRRSDPRSRRMSPYHNPMMLGGAIGAGVRYGAFALPLVGGAMGLNALSNTLHEYRAQETGLEFAAGMTSDPDKDVSYYRKYLRYVGDVTGQRESNLSRDFHQMLAGSAGTEMEPHLEEGFLGLTQYASILGLSDENMRLVMRGVTQMI